ncbi:hypothetical protein ACFSM5_21085 [Lacibacterium aquatile]|uniref:Nal1 C-terminal domain-containing protein n=1 Tax=Lacibacterium aquatile TaxID=1168082 RepID=A0ABW5DZM0_9PROT
MPSAADVGARLYDWAKDNGYLLTDDNESPSVRKPLSRVFNERLTQDMVAEPEPLIGRLQVVGVFHDEQAEKVFVCTKGAIPAVRHKTLPERLDGIFVEWIGSCNLHQTPPSNPAPPTSSSRAYRVGGRVACGSSISPANVHGAGTMGCLVTDENGTIYGLSNNHVTGGCNHMEIGMPILAPAPYDASPDQTQPLPLSIGRHHRYIPLQSGDPRVVPPQQHDAATFKIIDQALVTSMQGDSAYDTPAKTAVPKGGMRVKKVGRTTGLSMGTIIGVMSNPLPVPYAADKFRAHVYLEGGFAVRGDNDQPFSSAGDSGSLVVTADGEHAVGLIVAGMGLVTIMMPIQRTLDELNLRLLTGH